MISAAGTSGAAGAGRRRMGAEARGKDEPGGGEAKQQAEMGLVAPQSFYPEGRLGRWVVGGWEIEISPRDIGGREAVRWARDRTAGGIRRGGPLPTRARAGAAVCRGEGLLAD